MSKFHVLRPKPFPGVNIGPYHLVCVLLDNCFALCLCLCYNLYIFHCFSNSRTSVYSFFFPEPSCSLTSPVHGGQIPLSKLLQTLCHTSLHNAMVCNQNFTDDNFCNVLFHHQTSKMFNFC